MDFYLLKPKTMFGVAGAVGCGVGLQVEIDKGKVEICFTCRLLLVSRKKEIVHFQQLRLILIQNSPF